MKFTELEETLNQLVGNPESVSIPKLIEDIRGMVCPAYDAVVLALEVADTTICLLCQTINPQHQPHGTEPGCKTCTEREERLKLLAQAEKNPFRNRVICPLSKDGKCTKAMAWCGHAQKHEYNALLTLCNYSSADCPICVEVKGILK